MKPAACLPPVAGRRQDSESELELLRARGLQRAPAERLRRRLLAGRRSARRERQRGRGRDRQATTTAKTVSVKLGDLSFASNGTASETRTSAKPKYQSTAASSPPASTATARAVETRSCSAKASSRTPRTSSKSSSPAKRTPPPAAAPSSTTTSSPTSILDPRKGCQPAACIAEASVATVGNTIRFEQLARSVEGTTGGVLVTETSFPESQQGDREIGRDRNGAPRRSDGCVYLFHRIVTSDTPLMYRRTRSISMAPNSRSQDSRSPDLPVNI